MVEQWKVIDGCKNYFISNYGIVKSPKTILKQQLDVDGYSIVKIKYDGKRRNVKVHRLVAKAFILNPLNKPQVNHINGVKTDNRVENLEWVTAKENVIHEFKTGLLTQDKMIKAQSKKSKKIIRNINGKIIIYDSIGSASRDSGYTKTYIIERASKKLKSLDNSLWMYEE